MINNLACLICGSSEFKVKYESNIVQNNNDFDSPKVSVLTDKSHDQIVKCNKCGFTFVSPRSNEKIVLEASKKLSFEEYMSEQRNRELTFQNNLTLIERFNTKRGKLLDLGCSTGLFMKIAQSDGWIVKGVELSIENSEFARKEFKLDVITGNIEEINFGTDKYDVITMWDFLEHLFNPSNVLNKIHSLLDSNGLLVLSTPDIGSFFAKIMGSNWHSIVRIHYYYFDKLSLFKLLERHRFKIIYCSTYPRIFSVGYLVELIKSREFSFKWLGTILDVLLIRCLKLGHINIPIDFRDELFVVAKKI